MIKSHSHLILKRNTKNLLTRMIMNGNGKIFMEKSMVAHSRL